MGFNPTVKFQKLQEVPLRNNETGEVLLDSSEEPLTMPNPRSVCLQSVAAPQKMCSLSCD